MYRPLQWPSLGEGVCLGGVVCPGGCLPGGCLPESQTGVKTIPSHNYIADCKYWFVIQSVMGDRSIQPIIQAVTIDIMLNNNGLNIGEGLNYVKCEQT